MEALVLTILSIFAFLGVLSMVSYFLQYYKSKQIDSDVKLIVYIPKNSESKLEGLIRLIFLDEIPKKLGIDEKVYLITSTEDPETEQTLEDLKKLYPLEVLPDAMSYCMITEKDKEQFTSL